LENLFVCTLMLASLLSGVVSHNLIIVVLNFQ